MNNSQLWSAPLLAIILIQASFTCGVLECFECSDFPREEYSEDEEMGTCPGWLRPPRLYPDTSIYDGCMTILLANGTVVSQNAILYKECSNYQKSQRIALRNLFGISVRIRCCKGERCNAPRKLQAKLNRIRGQEREDKEKRAKEFMARYYSQDSVEDAEVDLDLAAVPSRQRGNKDGSGGGKDYEASPSCYCKACKLVSLEKQTVLLWGIMLRAFFYLITENI